VRAVYIIICERKISIGLRNHGQVIPFFWYQMSTESIKAERSWNIFYPVINHLMWLLLLLFKKKFEFFDIHDWFGVFQSTLHWLSSIVLKDSFQIFIAACDFHTVYDLCYCQNSISKISLILFWPCVQNLLDDFSISLAFFSSDFFDRPKDLADLPGSGYSFSCFGCRVVLDQFGKVGWI